MRARRCFTSWPAEIDGEQTVLEPGDSIHFPSTKVHSTWNHGSTPSTLLWVGTMDIFGDGKTNTGAVKSVTADAGNNTR